MTNYAEPRWSTPRTPSRETLGGRVAALARVLGQPLMPWQQHVVDVALEIDEDGFLAYRESGVSVMRQSGKTTTLLVVKVDRGYNFAKSLKRPQRIIYSAQTGKDGRDKLLDDEWPILRESPLAEAFREPRRTNGNEALQFHNGSIILNMASSDVAGHGKVVDLGMIDEAFADEDDHREQALIPGMATKPWAQLWVVSTMGTDTSLYLNRKVDKGRAGVEAGRTSDVCYFEWSVPDDEDIESPVVWAKYMPAYGITIGERAVRHAFETMTEGEFRRAWCNQRTQSVERVIPIDVWERACSVDVVPQGRATAALAINEARTAASIGAADTSGVCELIAHQDGIGWAIEWLTERRTRYAVAIDPSGPAGAYIDELERNKVKVERIAGAEVAQACGNFYDTVLADRGPFVVRNDDLSVAVGAVMKRATGDTWVWARKGVADISPLEAITLARFAAMRPRGKPTFAY